MNPGDVFFWKRFTFPKEGNVSDKPAILLNAPKDHDPFIFVPGTSQAYRGRKEVAGCNTRESYYFIQGQAQVKNALFPKGTWILLDCAVMILPSNLQACLSNGMVSPMGALDKKVFSSLLICVWTASDFEQGYKIFL